MNDYIEITPLRHAFASGTAHSIEFLKAYQPPTKASLRSEQDDRMPRSACASPSHIVSPDPRPSRGSSGTPLETLCCAPLRLANACLDGSDPMYVVHGCPQSRLQSDGVDPVRVERHAFPDLRYGVSAS